MKRQLSIAVISIICLFVFVYRNSNFGQIANTQIEAISTNNVQTAIHKADGKPAKPEVIHAAQEYINALRSRDTLRERHFLTFQAVMQSEQYQPPFEPTIVQCEKFEIGKVQFVSEESAEIHVVYELKDRTGRLTDDYSTVLLKKENRIWKVWGMTVNFPTREKQLTINFEDIPGTVSRLLALKQEIQSIEQDRLLAQQQAQRQQKQIESLSSANDKGARTSRKSYEPTAASSNDSPELAREINGIICK